jgi:hypothetical protein
VSEGGRGGEPTAHRARPAGERMHRAVAARRAALVVLATFGCLSARPAVAQRGSATPATAQPATAQPVFARGAPPDDIMPPEPPVGVTAVPRDGAESRTGPGAPPRLHHAAERDARHHHFLAGITTPPQPRPITPASARDARRYYARMALGFAGSILFHESAHVASSLLVGAHPTFGSDAGRPTVYSGIDANREPHKQLVFSSAGLVAQAALDEALLDIPHHTAGAFERGVLLGGVATALFYATLGRNASVSDVTYIARTSGWSKTRVSLLVGGVAALHAVRIARGDRYAHFFLAPGPDGRLRLACRIAPDA